MALDIYAGPMRKVVKQYTLREDIDLVVIAADLINWSTGTGLLNDSLCDGCSNGNCL